MDLDDLIDPEEIFSNIDDSISKEIISDSDFQENVAEAVYVIRNIALNHIWSHNLLLHRKLLLLPVESQKGFIIEDIKNTIRRLDNYGREFNQFLFDASIIISEDEEGIIDLLYYYIDLCYKEYREFNWDQFDDILIYEDIDTHIKLPGFKALVDIIIDSAYVRYLQIVGDIQTSKRKLPSLNSYEWLAKNSDEDILDLFNALSGKYISSECSCEDFRHVFSGDPLNEIQPIKWKRDIPSEVIYLIKMLSEYKFIEPNKRFIYIQLKKLFVKPDGNPFDQKLKQISNNIETGLSSKKQDELLKVVKSLT